MMKLVNHAALTPETGKDDPTLEVLGLRNNSIGSEGATAIAQVLSCNKTLKKVDLNWNNIGNKGLEAICQNIPPNPPKDFVLVRVFKYILIRIEQQADTNRQRSLYNLLHGARLY